uniref:Uncharacterized protein n=1 Tax=Aegilops tauschii subsp. strangulata TaxID=200361 RepID=A0A453CVN1_AEGTS
MCLTLAVVSEFCLQAGDVSDMETAAPAPVSSDEGRDATAVMEEEAVHLQNGEQTELLVEEPSQEDAGDVPAMETAQVSSDDENDDTEEIEEEQGQEDEGDVLDMETAVPALATSDEGSDDDAEEMEAAMDAQADEQTELVQEQDQEEGLATDVHASPELVEEEAAPVAEDCTVVSSVDEQQNDVQQCEQSPVALNVVDQEGHFPAETVSSEGPLDVEIHHAGEAAEEAEDHLSTEETEMVPMEAPESGEATEEDEDNQSTEETEMMMPVEETAEEVEEIQLSSEETEMVPVEEAEEVHHSSEETEMVPVEEAEKIHQSSEETEMVPVAESAAQATPVPQEADVEVGFTCHADTAIEKESEVLQSAAKANEEKEDLVEEEESEVLFGALFQSAAKTSENKDELAVEELLQHDMDEAAAEDDNEVSVLGALFQSAAKANQDKGDVAVEEDNDVSISLVLCSRAQPKQMRTRNNNWLLMRCSITWMSVSWLLKSCCSMTWMRLLQWKRMTMKFQSLVLCSRAQPKPIRTREMWLLKRTMMCQSLVLCSRAQPKQMRTRNNNWLLMRCSITWMSVLQSRRMRKIWLSLALCFRARPSLVRTRKIWLLRRMRCHS